MKDLHLFTEIRDGYPFITLAMKRDDGRWIVLARHILDCGSGELHCSISHIVSGHHADALLKCDPRSLLPELVDP